MVFIWIIMQNKGKLYLNMDNPIRFRLKTFPFNADTCIFLTNFKKSILKA